jgi:putative phosphoserine phosphatase/1-acylglycerol-3-phosphate O-acyltransferase
MAGAAAIFDLDRTLLRSSSTPAINEALFEAGLAPRSNFPGQGLMMRFYDVFGETVPSMALARAAALAARGWPAAEARVAAALAADRLEAKVLPYVPALLQSHREAGRKLVLATTTPFDLVAPLARRLGFDEVIATRYATEKDDEGIERYTGGLDGGFVWSIGKLRAVQRWARLEGIDLRASWAYSDSAYDLPLLRAVGHPTAVNPDFRLHAAATLQRWPIAHLDSPAGVPKLFGAEPLDFVRLTLQQVALPFARFDISGTEHIPRHGAAIVAANHRSYFDTAAYGMAVFEAGRNPRGLAKKELFDAPVIGTLMKASGAICVDRKKSGRAAFASAEQALRDGEILIIAPQGTIPRGEAFFEPQLHGKSGTARLAAATGAPVIPLGVWGTENVWPRSSRVPNVTNVLRPPTVRIRVGPAVAGLTGTDITADTELIMKAITALLPPEAHLRRLPTAEELARSMPTGRRYSRPGCATSRAAHLGFSARVPSWWLSRSAGSHHSSRPFGTSGA